MNDMVLITGASGFLGGHVSRCFAECGWRVVGVDPASPREQADFATYHSLVLPSPEFREVLRHYEPKLLIHCAGRASVPQSMSDPAGDFHSSVALTFELLNDIRVESPACGFLFLSSAAIYGNPVSLPVREDHPSAPLSPYGFHKLQCEQLCAEFAVVYGMRTASARIFSAYGEGLRRQVVWDICAKALGGGPLRLQGTGKESRDLIHAADVAKGLHAIANAAPMRGETYNLASGREVTIAQLAAMILSSLGVDKPVNFDGQVPPGTPLNWRADVGRIASLGFRPAISLEQGAGAVAAWCKAERALA